MASRILQVAVAAVVACLFLSDATGFAAPQLEPTVQSSTFGKAAAPALNAGWEPRINTATETSSTQSGMSTAFALSAAAGMAMAAKSRMGRLATKSPEEMYKTVIGIGNARMEQGPREVILSGIVTGFYIGFGGVLCSTVGGSALKLQPALQRFLFGAVGFPLSIFLTTIAGGQGFTPNISVMAAAFMRQGQNREVQPDRIGKMFANLFYAYLGNTIGLLTIAYLANMACLPAVPASIAIAKSKLAYSWMQIFIRGVLGAWLIGLAVWTSQAADDVASKFVTIWLCISTYVICQYEHCLANIFFVPCAIFGGAKITWGTFIMNNLIPSTLGNLAGGFCMLAGFYRLVYGGKCYYDEEDGVVCDVTDELAQLDEEEKLMTA